jgi:hypothetical protein
MQSLLPIADQSRQKPLKRSGASAVNDFKQIHFKVSNETTLFGIVAIAPS